MSKQGHAARMRRLVARWRASEESGASFARRHGVPPWTFWYWCRKVTEESTAAAPALVPVQVVESEVSAGVEIVLPTGERLRVTASASEDLVRTVVAALRSA
jgi:transposase-like protein